MGKSDKPEGRATASGPLSGTVAAKSSGQHSVLPTSEDRWCGEKLGAARGPCAFATGVGSLAWGALAKHAGAVGSALAGSAQRTGRPAAFRRWPDRRHAAWRDSPASAIGDGRTGAARARAPVWSGCAARNRPDTIDQDLVQRIPINFAKQHTVVLLRRNQADDTVEAAIADPTAVHVLDDIARVVLAEVSPYLAPAHQILEAINKVYSRAGVMPSCKKTKRRPKKRDRRRCRPGRCQRRSADHSLGQLGDLSCGARQGFRYPL